MDSKTLLDYALFQLTPTRTRCDLLVVSGKKTEKLASGLVEPFLAHLQYAKDHIPKGGYSITLRPPGACDDASWFTKATFQRFVRFVSTPEILERIIRVEKEILQIESSVQSSEIPNMEETGDPVEESPSVADKNMKSPNSLKLTAEEDDQRAALRENSRLRLQRLMDTRKALLLKEQAMAYARAVVAGYEMDTIDDLICFADAFGASRLRVACTDFKELYKKKHSDDIWMDELAAVQALPVPDLSFMGASGIMLTGDNFHNNGISTTPLVRTTSSDSTPTSENNFPAPEQTPNVQQQVPWMNPYMYNFQGPIQQMPPYQGYPYPGMPYYPGHMGWSPPGGVVPAKHHKSSRRKNKSVDENETDDSEEEDELTASGDSDTGTDLDEEKKENDKKHSSKGHRKKNTKKASKTVVIRNINYITSQRHNGEEENGISEDSSGDASSIREGVDNAIASLEKHAHSKSRKSRDIDGNISEGGKGGNNAWDAFQNILMSNEESNSKDSMDEHFVMEKSNGGLPHKSSNGFDFDSEKIKMRSLTIDDSVLAIQRGMENGGKADVAGFTNGQDIPPSMKRPVSTDESALFTQQFEGSRTNTIADFSSESSTIKIRNSEDWFVVNSSGGSQTHGGNQSKLLAYERDFAKKETTKGNALVDDSFIIESRSAADDVYASHWKTDISMDADIDASSSKPENGVLPAGNSASLESDELCMVLVRESRESGASWTPELDYEVEISFNESVIKKSSLVVEEPVANGKNSDPKKNGGPPSKTLKRGEKTKTTSAGSLSKSRLDSLSKSKTASSTSRLMMHKGGKLAKEEEERKRMEALLIERQKRIAERTAATGGGLASKKLPVTSKSSATPKKLSQHKFPAKMAA